MLVLKHKSNGSKIASGDRILRMTEDGRWFLNTGLDKWSEVVAESESAAPVPVEPAPVDPAPTDPAPEPEPVDPAPVSNFGPAAKPFASAEVITLDGGSLDLTGRSDVIIRGRAERIRVNGCQRVMIDATVHVLEATAQAGIEVRDSSDIIIAGCSVEGSINGIVVYGLRRFYIGGNKIDRIGADSFKIAGSKGGIFERNRGVINIAVLDGAHPDFCQVQGICDDITFRYNVNLNYGQGIYSGYPNQGPHSRLRIYANRFVASHGNQIMVTGQGIEVGENTILRKPGTAGKTAYISVTQVGDVPNVIRPTNVHVKNKGASGLGPIGLTLQVEDPAAPWYQGDYAPDLPAAGPYIEPAQLRVTQPGYGADVVVI